MFLFFFFFFFSLSFFFLFCLFFFFNDTATTEIYTLSLHDALPISVLKNAILVEYIPFIALLFSLYVISGGIVLEGKLVGTPKLNAGILAKIGRAHV